MSELEKQKYFTVQQIQALCAHCTNRAPHTCRLQALASEIISLSGVPLMVNDRFNGLLTINYDANQRI